MADRIDKKTAYTFFWIAFLTLFLTSPGWKSAMAQPPARDLDPLIRDLGNSDWTVRSQAASALGKIKDPQAVPALIKALQDPKGYVRRRAASALGEIKDPRAVEPLIHALPDPESYVRRKAAAALGKFNDSRAVEPLVKALRDKESEVRAEAVRSLGKINDPRAVEKLIPALQDEKEEVRRTAAIALGKFKDPRAVEPLIASFNDEKSTTVRRRVAVALGEIQDPRVDSFLNLALKNENLEIIAGAHAFFIRRGEKGSGTLLIRSLQEYGYIRMAENFSRCGNPALAQAGRDWIKNQGIQVKSGKAEKPLRWGSDK